MKTKTRIMFYITSLNGGGAERTVLNVLNNINLEKFEPILILGTKNRNIYLKYLKDEIQVINLNVKRLRYTFFKLRKIIKRDRPDVVFTTLIDNSIMLSLVKLSMFKKFKLVTREANTRSLKKSYTFFNRLLTRFSYNVMSNHTVALSKGVKNDMVSSFRINPKKIKVIYNPIDIKHISNQAQGTVELNNKATIIGVGRLVEQKNFALLIKAFAKISNEIEAELIILGTGDLYNELLSLTQELNVSDRVQLLGFQDNPYKYMRASDLFVLSSNYEGFGHVIVEAMTTGTPVLSTDCKSGPKEIIGDNEYGVLTPVGDVESMANNMLSLLNDQTKLNHYKKMGLDRAQDFDVKKIVKEYENLFEDILR